MIDSGAETVGSQGVPRFTGLFAFSVPSFDFWYSTTFWLYLFWIIWIHRYLRLLVHCISHWRYRSKPIPNKPTFTSRDVTVVIPTIHNAFEELWPSLQSILACEPAKLILVTTHDKRKGLQRLADSLGHPNIRILDTPIANKRIQVCEALPKVLTPITIMADDDVTWPSTLMPWILAPFEDPQIGGVGTSQRIKREHQGSWATRSWNWLGAAYIERRNFEISATHNIDGGTSYISGRTAAYRSEILSSHDFLYSFKNEKWRKWILNTDAEYFITRWLVSHQWKTWIQYERECEVETTLENNYKFLHQCSRWARSNWRSNWTSLVTERYVWKQQWWCTYSLYIATFTSLAFVIDPLLLASCWWATADWDTQSRQYAFWSQFIFMFAFTKVVKLKGLFLRDPSDIIFLPISILFGYFHGLIQLYALSTLNTTSWGSLADGDTNDWQRLDPAPQPCFTLKTPSEKAPLKKARYLESAYAGYYTRSSYTPIKVPKLLKLRPEYTPPRIYKNTSYMRVPLQAKSSESLQSNYPIWEPVDRSKILELSSILMTVSLQTKRYLKRMLRPKLRQGYIRLEWICDCGDLLYGDFEETSTGSLDYLAAALGGHTAATARQTPSSSATTPSRTRPRASHLVGWVAPGDDKIGTTTQHWSDPSGPSTARDIPKQFLELCVKSGEFTHSLGEIEVEHYDSDGRVFEKIKKKYEDTRAALLPWYLRFRKPVKAIFVEFRLDKKPYISRMTGSVEEPVIPPTTEVEEGRYSYAPCPIMDPSPMDTDTFMHYFYTPSCKHPGSLWTSRLPKKLGDKLSVNHEPLKLGWGIKIEEGINGALLLAAMFIIVFLSGLVAGMYAMETGDKQTAVAIGGWLTAVQTLGVSLIVWLG